MTYPHGPVIGARSQGQRFNILAVGLTAVLVLLLAILVIRWTRPGPDLSDPLGLTRYSTTGTSPSAIPAPTDIERVRVSMYGVRIIPCSSADLYEGEPAPSLCLYAENGHVSQAHLPPAAAPQ